MVNEKEEGELMDALTKTEVYKVAQKLSFKSNHWIIETYPTYVSKTYLFQTSKQQDDLRWEAMCYG